MPSRQEQAGQKPLRRYGGVASRLFDRTMTAVLGGIGRPLPVFNVTNVTFVRCADEQVTSGVADVDTLLMRQSCIALIPHGSTRWLLNSSSRGGWVAHLPRR
jgi:hypothetical protein